MKLTAPLLFATIALTQNLASAHAGAQPPATAKPASPTHASTHAATHASYGAGGCAKLPELSPKIPALAASLPCAKPLYTISAVPNIKLDYVSPLEGSVLKETLGLESSSFSLDYVDVKMGNGQLAAPHMWYSIQYTGYLTDGTKFDSSYDHANQEPFSFPYGGHQVIAGWDTGFAGMRVGGKRRLFIPFQLAYGPNAHGAIPPKSLLIFDVEFVSQSAEKPEPPPAAKSAPATPPAAATPARPVQPPTAAPTPATPPPASAPSATTPKPQ
jgi:peptidylprolyl isomerase